MHIKSPAQLLAHSTTTSSQGVRATKTPDMAVGGAITTCTISPSSVVNVPLGPTCSTTCFPGLSSSPQPEGQPAGPRRLPARLAQPLQLSRPISRVPEHVQVVNSVPVQTQIQISQKSQPLPITKCSESQGAVASSVSPRLVERPKPTVNINQSQAHTQIPAPAQIQHHTIFEFDQSPNVESEVRDSLPIPILSQRRNSHDGIISISGSYQPPNPKDLAARKQSISRGRFTLTPITPVGGASSLTASPSSACPVSPIDPAATTPTVTTNIHISTTAPTSAITTYITAQPSWDGYGTRHMSLSGGNALSETSAVSLSPMTRRSVRGSTEQSSANQTIGCSPKQAKPIHLPTNHSAGRHVVASASLDGVQLLPSARPPSSPTLSSRSSPAGIPRRSYSNPIPSSSPASPPLLTVPPSTPAFVEVSRTRTFSDSGMPECSPTPSGYCYWSADDSSFEKEGANPGPTPTLQQQQHQQQYVFELPGQPGAWKLVPSGAQKRGNFRRRSEPKSPTSPGFMTLQATLVTLATEQRDLEERSRQRANELMAFARELSQSVEAAYVNYNQRISVLSDQVQCTGSLLANLISVGEIPREFQGKTTGNVDNGYECPQLLSAVCKVYTEADKLRRDNSEMRKKLSM